MLELYQPFWQLLKSIDIDKDSIHSLIAQTNNKLTNPTSGNYPRWYKAYKNLPDIDMSHTQRHLNQNAITCKAELSQADKELIQQAYQQLIPWRKGPFTMFSTYIDSEWQSFMKWNRIEKFLPDITNKIVLDVGCGNGYYMFRMIDKKPYLLMGIDPGLLQLMQFWSIEKYMHSKACVLPLAIGDMPKKLNCFDVVFSMGVLYHRKSPIHHIMELADCIKPNGYLVMETLVVDGNDTTCLLPVNRYAQMRNVWFLPSVAMLMTMLQRNGFGKIKCIDITTTTVAEQRTTNWMKFHSLKEFLNRDQSKTIEGYQLPTRATLVAQKN
ncbi:tRNA (mo5U34)-methyltransferase [hydrothermal vent metagenome]|uniref:tRNA (Mo5U34)-methyltransferase n=1 Tax=hydrothermal vent metagenome TaxID=652676 RepID=A0A3B0USP7_9ZZZZ